MAGIVYWAVMMITTWPSRKWLHYPVRKIPAPVRFLCALLLALNTGFAQDLEPRTYTNIPVGQNFLGVGYAYSDGELNPSASSPIKDADITIDGPVIAYARSLDLWGNAGKVDVSWARICIEGSAINDGDKIKADRCGAADPKFGFSYLFYGAPSMTMQEFRRKPTGRVAGVSLKVRPPLGDYNNENLVNSGSNRWTFKPEIGISNVFGKWSVDAAFAVRLYTDNNRFTGHNTQEQDPLYQVQTHLIYSLPRGRWISLNGNYFWGGESQINGVEADDRQENSRLGITFAWPLNVQHSLKFYANRGVVTRIGNDSDTVGVMWQYRWGDS